MIITDKKKLQIEIREDIKFSKAELGIINERIMITPVINKDYWIFRVKVSDDQAIVGFPKFGTIGIGFAVEEDWNTNLPSRDCEDREEEIFGHIQHNKGKENISDEICVEAIRMVNNIAAKYMHRKNS